jgi:hypothetical protein
MRSHAQTRYCSLPMHLHTRNVIAWLAAAVILCGCGAKQDGGAAAPGPVVKRPANPAQALSRNMVSALPASKPAVVPVQVRFALHSRPSAGQPLDVALALLPTSAAIDRIATKIVTDDDLALVEGAELASADRPALGVPIERAIKVLPRRDGIFTLKAVVTVDSGADTSSETFSMPLIVGEGVGQPPPAAPPTAPAAPPPTAATTQRAAAAKQ